MFNKGKDVSLNTVRLEAWTEPSVMTMFAGQYYDMYSLGMHNFLTQQKVTSVHKQPFLS